MKNKTLLFIFLFFLFSLTTAYARLVGTPLNLGYNTDNTEAIATAATSVKLYDVTLSDRTIYADGSWNTLTLPFSLTSSQIAKSPLNGFTIKKLDAATSGLDGEKLTLNFNDATIIEAGKPYIVQWQSKAEYDLLISNKSDWDAFADRVNSGETFEGKTVMLADNFDNNASPVTKMVGYYSWDDSKKVATSHPFKGTFDGNGRTLTVNISSNEEYTAPFRSANGATVKNLRIAGNIQISKKLIGGMFAFAAGYNVISNCRVSATITSTVNGDGTVGGFVSNIQGGRTNIENSLFDGSFVGSNTYRWSGFVGWVEASASYSHTGTAASLSISNSLFSPTSINVRSSDNNNTFYRGRSGYTPTLTKCYYTKTFGSYGTKQGTDASSMNVSDLVSNLGSNWENVSGNAVLKITTTTISLADIVNPTFYTVFTESIDANASTVATSTDGHVILNGTYGPFANTDGLLFDAHNTANGAFHAALSVAARDGYICGWYTDAGKTTPATSIPFAPDGSVTLYTKWKKLLTHTDIAVANIADQTYTGSAICPAINVTDGEKTLELGTDYTTTCTNNISVGTAEMTITGMGGYAGSITKTFEITTKEISIVWGKLTLFYNGTEQAPTATAEGLVNSDDCTITVSGAAKDVGTYTATASVVCSDDHKRNYKLPTENLEKTFEITYTNLATLDGNYTAQNGEILTGTLAGNYKISIADGATVTLDGVEINGVHVNKWDYKWAGINCEGDCNIILAENSSNIVKGFHEDYPGIYVPSNKTLTISGTGSLNASSNGWGAGICGGRKISCGNVEISGGSVTATGSAWAAGIGGGDYGSVGNITISGGDITATGEVAGIGGGSSGGTIGNIAISGGTVTATGGHGSAGVGSSYEGSVENIVISGGIVTAAGGYEAAGIGCGYKGTVGDIEISGGIITATGGTSGAGIGSGYQGNAGNIAISGGTITATGGASGAGIGGGAYGSVKDIAISGEKTKVNAIKGSYSWSIGRGIGGYSGSVTIGGVKSSDIKTSPFIYPATTQYAAVQILEYNSGTRAVIDGMYGGEDAVNITDDITVNSVEITREFPTGSDNAFSTTVLPFDVNTANVSGLRAVLYYNGIKNGSTISMKVLWAEKGYIKNKDGSDKEYEHAQMAANTPYLVLMKNSEFKLKSEAYPITLKQTAPANTEIEGCNWVFHGTWKYKKWGSSCSTGKQDCDKETGFAYGFAASASEDNKIDVGTFVKVGEGAWIRPMRAYLVRKDKLQTPQFARANGAYVKRPTVEPEELPELMSIVIDGDGDENETTVIGQFNTRTGEFKMNYDRGKFDLKGRRVNSEKPNARGAYYGKKVLKK